MLTTVTSYGRKGSSARVRVFDWIDFLGIEAESYSYTNGSTNNPTDLLRRPLTTVGAELALRNLSYRRSTESLIISRRASPLSTGNLEKKLLESAQKGIYDFDDAIMMHRGTLGGRVSDRPRWKNGVTVADVVIAGNEYLAETAVLHNQNVQVIPSCVNPAHYRQKLSYERSEGEPVAVWLGSPSTERYLVDIAPALLHEHERSGLLLKIISSGNGSLGILDQMIDRRDWDLTRFAEDLASADFGVMPLPDTAWSKGKCAYKLLQYGATALPAIASPVGANKAAIESLGAMSASTLQDWKLALSDLVDASAQDRARAGRDGLRGVKRDYSFAAWGKEWVQAVL